MDKLAADTLSNAGLLISVISAALRSVYLLHDSQFIIAARMLHKAIKWFFRCHSFI